MLEQCSQGESFIYRDADLTIQPLQQHVGQWKLLLQNIITKMK